MTDESEAFRRFVDRLKRALDHFGPVPLTDEDGLVEAPAEGAAGFAVRAARGDDGIAVGYDRWHWHEDFQSEDEALNCFMSGVFGESRLAVSTRCRFAHSWTAEVLVDGDWVPISTTGYFLFPFGCKRQIKYLRNERTPRATGE